MSHAKNAHTRRLTAAAANIEPVSQPTSLCPYAIESPMIRLCILYIQAVFANFWTMQCAKPETDGWDRLIPLLVAVTYTHSRARPGLVWVSQLRERRRQSNRKWFSFQSYMNSHSYILAGRILTLTGRLAHGGSSFKSYYEKIFESHHAASKVNYVYGQLERRVTICQMRNKCSNAIVANLRFLTASTRFILGRPSTLCTELLLVRPIEFVHKEIFL